MNKTKTAETTGKTVASEIATRLVGLGIVSREHQEVVKYLLDDMVRSLQTNKNAVLVNLNKQP